MHHYYRSLKDTVVKPPFVILIKEVENVSEWWQESLSNNKIRFWGNEWCHKSASLIWLKYHWWPWNISLLYFIFIDHGERLYPTIAVCLHSQAAAQQGQHPGCHVLCRIPGNAQPRRLLLPLPTGPDEKWGWWHADQPESTVTSDSGSEPSW